MKPDVQELLMSSGGREEVKNVAEAYSWCKRLATSHYENFPVASRLMPARLRLHIAAVYAFSRFADDIADEPWTNSAKEREQALEFVSAALLDRHLCVGHPVFTALHHTVEQFKLPLSPFQRLLAAFKSDVNFVPRESMDDVFEYCSNSANPVGELMLRIFGETNQTAYLRSNDVCTALQIINFIQDTSVDLARGRRNYPCSVAKAIEISAELVESGAEVARLVSSLRLRLELKFIIAGGIRVLQKCRQLGNEIHNTRPSLNYSDYLRILFRVVFGSWNQIR